MQIEYHPLFWEDVEAQALYLEQEAGLGTELLEKVDGAIESATSQPLSHSRLYENTRSVILDRFRKHSIHFEYSSETNCIRFFGLFHSSENPSKWPRRQ